jgi:hypothetical protein
MSAEIRLDQVALFLLEQCCKSALEPQFKGAPIWENGGREIAAEAIKRAGVPSAPVTSVDFCRGLGLFPISSNSSRGRS